MALGLVYGRFGVQRAEWFPAVGFGNLSLAV